MKSWSFLFALASCCLFTQATADCSPPQQEPVVCLQMVNQERQAAGLQPLVFDDALLDCTDVRAREIVSLFEHTRPDGSDCFSIIQQRGIQYRTVGENIAYGTGMDGAMAYDVWLNSPPHHENYMNPAYDRIGISACDPGDGNVYWVQMFSGGQRGGKTYDIDQLGLNQHGSNQALNQPQDNQHTVNQSMNGPSMYDAPPQSGGDRPWWQEECNQHGNGQQGNYGWENQCDAGN